MIRMRLPAVLASCLLIAAPAAQASGSLTWHVSATASTSDCLIRVAVITTGHGFTGEVITRNGEIVVSEPVSIPASGGKDVAKLHISPGVAYTVQLTTRNGFLKRQTQVQC
jgi:hypothetical protein